MGLKNTRKILSVILAVMVAVSSAVMIFSFTLSATLSTKTFVVDNLANDKTAAACEAQLNAKFDALEAKSAIPARVFKMIETDFPTSSSLALAASNLFGAESSTLYSQDKVDYFYKLCTEYLEGNEIRYKKENVKRVSEEAAKIYSDCVGLHNLEALRDYLPVFNKNCAKIASAALLITMLCLMLLTILYNDKIGAYTYFASALSAGGISVSLACILCVLTKLSSAFVYTPQIYQQSIASMANKYFVITAFAGLILFVLGCGSLIIIQKQISRKQTQTKTRFSKIIGKL